MLSSLTLAPALALALTLTLAPKPHSLRAPVHDLLAQAEPHQAARRLAAMDNADVVSGLPALLSPSASPSPYALTLRPQSSSPSP